VEVLSDELVKIIDARSNDLAYVWYEDVSKSQYTPHIKTLSRDEGLNMSLKVLKKLSDWLKPGVKGETRQTFVRFGEQSYFKGFKMDEMIQLLILLKRHIWLHLLAEGIMTTNIEVYQALDVNNKVVLFFDRAIYFSLIGFQQARGDARKAKLANEQ
jgi:hypothetical protein